MLLAAEAKRKLASSLNFGFWFQIALKQNFRRRLEILEILTSSWLVIIEALP